MRVSKVIRAVAAVGALGAAGPALAHHAVNAQFDVTNEVALTGMLTNVRAINPHSVWQFDMKNAQGQVEQWTFESAAPAILRQAGVRLREDVKVGGTYTVYFNPPRANQKMGFMRAIEINGKKVPITNLAEVRGD
jgi:hypothetical protein